MTNTINNQITTTAFADIHIESGASCPKTRMNLRLGLDMRLLLNKSNYRVSMYRLFIRSDTARSVNFSIGFKLFPALGF